MGPPLMPGLSFLPRVKKMEKDRMKGLEEGEGKEKKEKDKKKKKK